MSEPAVTLRRERPGKVAIMRAAVSVMGENGYEGATMRDMAARAGVAVAAVYHHFSSKHDLLHEFLEESYDVLLARLERRLAAAGPAPTDQLDTFVATLIWSYLHDDFAQMAANVALREYGRLRPAERASVDARRNEVLDVCEQVVRQGVEAGEFTAADARESARAITILCSSLVEPFPVMARSLDEVIGLYQHFARRVVDASAPEAAKNS